jgi:prepilin-type N-terminal cleavage/methylation domain-containing protein
MFPFQEGENMRTASGSQRGFTLIEIMIVVVIIAILAGIAIPNYLNLKDKAIWGTAKANMDVIRSALASYATEKLDNYYPIGTLDFSGMRTVLPHASLPAAEELAKFQTGTFSYVSGNGHGFTFSVNCNNKFKDLLTATPSGITPDSFDDYVR